MKIEDNDDDLEDDDEMIVILKIDNFKFEINLKNLVMI